VMARSRSDLDDEMDHEIRRLTFPTQLVERPAEPCGLSSAASRGAALTKSPAHNAADVTNFNLTNPMATLLSRNVVGWSVPEPAQSVQLPACRYLPIPVVDHAADRTPARPVIGTTGSRKRPGYSSLTSRRQQSYDEQDDADDFASADVNRDVERRRIAYRHDALQCCSTASR
jgi:hypothetical protein